MMQLKFCSSSLKIFTLVMDWNAGGSSSRESRDFRIILEVITWLVKFILSWLTMKHFLNDELVSIDNWSTTCSKYLTHVASIVIHTCTAGHEIRHRPVLDNFDMSGFSDLYRSVPIYDITVSKSSLIRILKNVLYVLNRKNIPVLGQISFKISLISKIWL